ncbi:hypothetical protein AmDm5_2847 [Acetobacter malorum]|nr:hypothetical protein AmDm5_2847 [Acetobacter malorum]
MSHQEHQARWTLKFIKAKTQDDRVVSFTDLAILFFRYARVS